MFEDLRERLGRAAGRHGRQPVGRPMPMGGGTMARFSVDGLTAPARRDGPPARTSAVLASVGPAFFKTLQIAAVERPGSHRDGTPPARLKSWS